MKVGMRLKATALTLAVLGLSGGGATAQPAGPAGSTLVPVSSWNVLLPDGGYPELPLLMAEADYSEDNDLRSLAIGCSGQRYYLFVIAPGFSYRPVNQAALVLDGGDIPLELRDLYGAPAAAAPTVDWDADVLYGDIREADVGRLGRLASVDLALADRVWTVPLNGIEEPLERFLGACAQRAR